MTEPTLPTLDADVWGPEHDQPIELVLTRTTTVLLDFLSRETAAVS